MSTGDFLKNLSLDAWYKVCLYLGGIAFLISLFIDVKGITNSQLQLLSSGIFLIGLGEWKNHKEESFIKPPNAYTGPATWITVTRWKPDFIGLLLDAVGIILVVLSVVAIASSSTLPVITTTPSPIPSPAATVSSTPTVGANTP